MRSYLRILIGLHLFLYLHLCALVNSPAFFLKVLIQYFFVYFFKALMSCERKKFVALKHTHVRRWTSINVDELGSVDKPDRVEQRRY